MKPHQIIETELVAVAFQKSIPKRVKPDGTVE
jgi:hypothetical protein